MPKLLDERLVHGAYASDFNWLPNEQVGEGYRHRLYVNFDLTDESGEIIGQKPHSKESGVLEAKASYAEYTAWREVNEPLLVAEAKLLFADYQP
jgi:hypothetical protein